MNELWADDPTLPKVYGSLIFGDGNFGNMAWDTETETTVTWTSLAVVADGGIEVTSSQVPSGGTGQYFGNWSNGGGNGYADKLDITSFDSSGGLRVSLADSPNSQLTSSNPSGGLPDNDKIIFWGDDLPSNLVAGTVYYVKQTSDATKINLRTAVDASAIAYVDSGSGTNYCSTTFFETTGGVGSGFIGTYDVNLTDGKITSVNIIESGSYTSLPSFTATCPSTRYHFTGYTGFPACLTASVTFSGSSDGLSFTDTDHTLIDGDEIQFTTSGTLPGNITTGTNYYVNDKTDTTFKVETAVGGGNVQYSATAGSGIKYGKTTAT